MVEVVLLSLSRRHVVLFYVIITELRQNDNILAESLVHLGAYTF